MSRLIVLGVRVLTFALLATFVALGSMWAYVLYDAHRAKAMLVEVSRIRVGDSEASILPLVQRYGGFKWTPEPLLPREQWIDKDEYDYQKRRVQEYQYELGISPFGTTFGWTSRWTEILRAVGEAFPSRLRPTLGMRDWGAGAELAIRRGHVQSVSTKTIFAGRSKMLGHSWELAEGMPRSDMPPRAYAIGMAYLTMSQGFGSMIENYLTPEASEEEIEAAHQFNADCWTTVKGCNDFCDVAPRTLTYLKQHPDAAWNIVAPICR